MSSLHHPPEKPPSIEEKLISAWRREQRYSHARGLGYLLLTVPALVAFDLLVDWLLDLPAWARALLLAINLTVIIALLWRRWWASLQRYDPVRLALKVERLHPELRSLLVSHVQLSSSSGHGSPSLIEALHGQAQQAAGPLDFLAVVDFRTLRGLLGLALGILLLFLGSTFLLGAHYRVLWQRILPPFANVSYPTRTQIVSVTGPVLVRRGESVSLRARVEGEIPEQGTLEIRQGDEPWERLPASREQEGNFRARVANVQNTFAYRFHLGDARSVPHPVTVVQPPRLLEAQLTIQPPRYLNGTSETHGLRPMPSIPAGSSLRWRLHLDCELKAGHLQPTRPGARPIALRIDPNNARRAHLEIADVHTLLADAPRVMTLPGPVREGGSRVEYRFRWTERQHGFEFTELAPYHLEVVPDTAPMVRLLKPALPATPNALLATVRKTLTLLCEARDDHGLEDAWLVYRLNAGKENRLPLQAKFQGKTVDTVRIVWTLQKALPALKEGDQLSCQVMVSDQRAGPEGPNTGRSPLVRLAVVSEADYLRWVERQKKRGLDQTRLAAGQEVKSSRKVRTLIPEETNR